MSEQLYFSTPYDLEKRLLEMQLESVSEPDSKNLLFICPGYDVSTLCFSLSDFYKSKINSIYVIESDGFNRRPDFINLKVMQGDIFESLPSVSGIDICIITRVIEHFDYDQIYNFTYLMSRVLNPNGVILCTYPDFEVITSKLQIEIPPSDISFKFWLYELFNIPGEYDSHKIYLNKNIIKEILTKEGYFDIVDLFDCIAIESNRYLYNTIAAIKH